MKRCMRLGGYFVASTLTFMLITCLAFVASQGLALLSAYVASIIGGAALTEFAIYMLLFCGIVAGIITFIERDNILKD